MVATTGYQAGVETTQTQWSYGFETAWGTKPPIQFQALRFTGETLGKTRTRQRPLEINATREAAAAVTVQEQVGGAINFAMSYGTYDDLFAIALGNEWTAPLTIQGAAADITLTNLSSTTATLSSPTANKFQNVTLGSYIRLLGFTNAVNNGIWLVSAKASNVSLTLTSTRSAITETPATTLAGVRGSALTNSTEIRTIWLQEQLAANLFYEYPGSFVTGFSLQAQIGQFFNGSFNLLCKDEQTAVTNQSTGAVLAAPGGRVITPTSGYLGTLLDSVTPTAIIDQLNLTVANTGSVPEYGLGTAGSAGFTGGYLEASGTFRAFFPDFNLYTMYVAEAQHLLAFQVQDANTDAYVISFGTATLSDAKVNAGGPGQPVYASMAFMADPAAAGGTMRFDKLPHV